MYAYTYEFLTTLQKEVLNFRENRDGYKRKFEARKRKSEIL